MPDTARAKILAAIKMERDTMVKRDGKNLERMQAGD